jgi:hypothetical protein
LHRKSLQITNHHYLEKISISYQMETAAPGRCGDADSYIARATADSPSLLISLPQAH